MMTAMILGVLAAAHAADAAPTAKMIEGEPELAASGFQFTEGPVWAPALETLLFSDIPANRIYRLDKDIFREPSGQSNGLMLDGQARLLAAEHENRRVSRTERDGGITVLADRFEGKRLNSPNDLIVRGDGVVFFTDPPYGLDGGLDGPNAELDFCGVYAVTAPGDVVLLARDFVKPNGIALSPGEKTLYVADTDRAHIRAFDVAEDATLSNGRVFFELPFPDGMAVDADGNVWATGGRAVHVIRPDGTLIQAIEFPEIPANCTFGGPDGKTLYVTARKGVYTVRTAVAGLAPVYAR